MKVEITPVDAPPPPELSAKERRVALLFTLLREEHDDLMRQRPPPQGTNLWFAQGNQAQRMCDLHSELEPLARELGGKHAERAERWERTCSRLWQYYWGG